MGKQVTSMKKTSVQRLLSKKRKGCEGRSKRINTEPPLEESEDKLETSYKFENDEEGEGAHPGSGSGSSPNDNDLDIPIKTGGKFHINEEVARKRAMEEKEKTKAKLLKVAQHRRKRAKLKLLA